MTYICNTFSSVTIHLHDFVENMILCFNYNVLQNHKIEAKFVSNLKMMFICNSLSNVLVHLNDFVEKNVIF